MDNLAGLGISSKPEDLIHLSPLGWEQINLTGDHAWGGDQTTAPDTLALTMLGTCRLGDDPQKSVVDRFHRTHDIPNQFLCDGSSLVTSGRGQRR